MLASARKCANARATGSANSIGIVARRSGRPFEICVRARTSPLGQPAHFLDQREERITLADPQHLAQQLSQQPHIVPQRLVDVDQHRSQCTGCRDAWVSWTSCVSHMSRG